MDLNYQMCFFFQPGYVNVLKLKLVQIIHIQGRKLNLDGFVDNTLTLACIQMFMNQFLSNLLL